jgi:hypothetical protein
MSDSSKKLHVLAKKLNYKAAAPLLCQVSALLLLRANEERISQVEHPMVKVEGLQRVEEED